MIITDLLLQTLPSNRLYEFNLNYFLHEFKELQIDWANTEEVWNTTKDFIDKYFDDLDIQEEINNKIDDMYNDGSLQTMINELIGVDIYPVFVSDVSEMTDIRKIYILEPTGNIYTYKNGTFHDTGINYQTGNMPVTATNILVSAENVETYNDFNEYTKNKIYAIRSDALEFISNKPEDMTYQHNALLIDYGYSSSSNFGRIQMLKSISTAYFYIRGNWGGTWSPWKSVSGDRILLTTTPSEEIYKDVNTFPSDSTIFISANITEEDIANLPVYGYRCCVRTEKNLAENAVVQTFTSNIMCFSRIYWGVYGWGNWLILNTAGVTITNDNIDQHNDVNNFESQRLYNISATRTSEDIANIPIDKKQQVIYTLGSYNNVTHNDLMGMQFSVSNEGLLYIRQKYGSEWLDWYKVGFTGYYRTTITSAQTPTEPWNDANTFPDHIIVAVNTSRAKVANIPVENRPLLIVTFGVNPKSTVAKLQLALSTDENALYWRSSWASWSTESGESIQWRGWQSTKRHYVNTIVDKSKKLSSTSKIITFGDSLSAKTGGGTPIMAQLANMIGAANYNYGVPGAFISNDMPNSIIAQIRGNTPPDTPDHAFIFGGTNDAANRKDIDNFKTSITEIITELRSLYPNIHITYCTPFQQATGGRGSSELYAGVATSVFLNADCDVVDCLNSPLNPSSGVVGINSYYADSVHPNGTGKKIMARYILQYYS